MFLLAILKSQVLHCFIQHVERSRTAIIVTIIAVTYAF